MKKLKMWIPFVTLLFLLAGTFTLQAQRRQGVTLEGYVYEMDEDQKLPVPYASVSIASLSIAVTTDENGHYVINNLPARNLQVTARFLGLEERTIEVDLSKQQVLDFVLLVSNFRLEEIVVTAESNKAGAATASKINKTAMEHMQLTSLADVMSLLPGAATVKSDLTSVTTASIRGGSSLGTAILMDGAPISNNANMQILSSAIGGSTPSTSGTTPSIGVDLRTITTDNIESIEVIRGVPSVEYGDITAGAIIVNSKTGRQPLSIKFNTNPNLYQGTITHGVNLGKNAGSLNYSGDYSYSVSDPREGYDFFRRVTARIGYSNTIGKWYTNTSVSFLSALDKGEPNPDDEQDVTIQRQNDLGIRANTRGTFTFNRNFFKSMEYNIQFAYTDRDSYFYDEATNATVAYSLSKHDGAVLSSIHGNKIYDVNGNLVTNVPAGEEYSIAWTLPSQYKYDYTVDGRELNTFAKVKANFAGDLGPTSHRMVIGADFKSDGNIGEGKIFDPLNPPYRSVSYTDATQRERSYKEIPFVNQFSLFAEENFDWEFASRHLQISAGIRYDHVLNFGGGFSPRVNASIDILPKALTLNAAFGITRKAPTLAYLYPDKAYFDLLNFDNSTSSYGTADQHFQVITTRIFDTENEELKMAKTQKIELGLSGKIGQVTYSVVAYKEAGENGYTFSKGINTFKSVPLTIYPALKQADYPADGSLPALKVPTTYQYLISYSQPSNNGVHHQKGIEFDINFGRIDAIRTSFILNGAWYESEDYRNGYSFWNKNKSTSYDQYPHMGVFDGDVNGTTHYRNFSTNLIITHNIPELGFVVSLTANVVWGEKAWQTYGNDTIPVAYISRQDGKLYDFDPAWFDDPAKSAEFAGIDRRNDVSDMRMLIEPTLPPLICFNFNVTKQFGDFLDVSFYAQNMFRSTPLYESQIHPGSYKRRNANVFFFGLQLTAKIK
ncbi:MAG TPA: TonB-dependent receptor [Bacteroidales bacterium]|jgi:hypothetical protein|nr:TonB-dependent receptor [Bacteroidales bacterium]MCZ2317565.1 TonB-dependent receptor [Bacteroidales bacterium]NLZ08348.1 TonB-dependent receptor [Bacteroidales bacterium]HNR28410.1 TonB-dependent receptor [Bacteroidales bacterium]HNT48311.1 TonB-dependent receptor [Bacteroidales bacterium]